MREPRSFGAKVFIPGRHVTTLLATGLLVIQAVLLIASARQESQSFDESTHLGAGFAYWKHGDFGNNPEHPPLVKFLAAIPLLPLGLKEPVPSHAPFFKAQENSYGSQLLYSQVASPDTILFRGRVVIMLFSVGLGLLLFLAAQELFGPLVGLSALVLYVFQPLLLGNGNVVTTDVALACLLFASVYAFYRFCDRPTFPRFALCAIATCLTIDSKHSGVLVLPILVLLALLALLYPSDLFHQMPNRKDLGETPDRRLIALAICALFVLGYGGIWAIYGFRYAQLHITPPLPVYAAGLIHPFQRNFLLWLDRHHLFPEPYLYGWVDILLIPSTRPSFLLGHIYSKPQWFFFPAAFLIKSTLALLVFLLLLPFAWIAGHRRQLLFFALPAAFFFVVSVVSMMNGGARYLIPMYPFCILLAGAAAAALFQRSTASRLAVVALLLLSAVSALHSYPNFLAYSNELFGGPAHTYQALDDADADWGQGLKLTRAYLAKHPDPNCWFDYYGNPGVSGADYGIPCKPLLSSFAHLVDAGTPPIPATITGTILISSTDIDGPYWGPGDLNPYRSFRDRKPDAMIGNIILVYHGTFQVPLLAAETNAVAANGLLRQHKLPEALALAQTAAEQAPSSADVQATFAQILFASGRIPEGQQANAKALHLAQTDYPEFQQYIIDQVQHPPSHP